MIYFVIALLALAFIVLRVVVARSRNAEDERLDETEDEDWSAEDDDDDDFGPEILDERAVKTITEAAQKLSGVFGSVGAALRPGMTTAEIEQLSVKLLDETGLGKAMLGYHGFPASAAVSINEEVVHGLPSRKRRIEDGDIVKVQINGEFERVYAAMGWTFPIGPLDDEKQKLLRAGRKALDRAVEAVQPGARTGDVGSAIQTTLEAAGFAPVRDFVGYGMGHAMMGEPKLSCAGIEGRGPLFRAGQILNVHVIANAGEWEVNILEDDWTAVTADGRPSVLFTAMVLVTPDSHEVLTQPPSE